MVSNAPEAIGPNGGGAHGWTFDKRATLYKALIPVLQRTQRIRVFLWHLNRFDDQSLFASILVSGATVTSVSNRTASFRREFFVDPSDAGTCLAAAQLYGTLEPIEGTVTIEDEVSIWSKSLDPADSNADPLRPFLLGAVVEFDVNTSENDDVRVRVSISSENGDWGDWSDDVCSAYNNSGTGPHIRGWWPYSRVRFRGDDFEMRTTQIVQVGSCEQGGPEVGPYAFGKQDNDYHGTTGGNKGCFGADLEYAFKVTNTGAEPQPTRYLLAMVCSRFTGSKYWGAGRCKSNPVSDPRKIPKLFAYVVPFGGQQLHELVFLTEQFDQRRVAVSDGTDQDIIVEIAHGGAATMPVSIILSQPYSEGAGGVPWVPKPPQ